MRKRPGLFVVLSMVASLAWGQSLGPPPNFNAAISYLYKYLPSYDECVAKAGTSIYELLDCTKAELAYQDSRLNKAYKVLMTRAQPEKRAKLRSDENIWIQYRDTNCPRGPSDTDSPIGEYESCVLAKTADQANYLEAMIDRL